MKIEKIKKLASTCFDNDEAKTDVFMELLNELGLFGKTDMTEITMVLPKEDCIHESKNSCLAEFPDSIKECKQPCNFYIGCDSIRNENRKN